MKIAKIIARAAIIAALYTGLTYAFAFSSFVTWTVQFRVSEVLTILPLFWGEAVVGLWVGCLLGNLISAPLDIVFGSTATLIAALLTFFIGQILRRGKLRVFLGAIPPVLVNALVVSGSVPPTGLPLPLISSGNTSLIFTMAAMGVLYNISKQQKRAPSLRRRQKE